MSSRLAEKRVLKLVGLWALLGVLSCLVFLFFSLSVFWGWFLEKLRVTIFLSQAPAFIFVREAFRSSSRIRTTCGSTARAPRTS